MKIFILTLIIFSLTACSSLNGEQSAVKPPKPQNYTIGKDLKINQQKYWKNRGTIIIDEKHKDFKIFDKMKNEWLAFNGFDQEKLNYAAKDFIQKNEIDYAIKSLPIYLKNFINKNIHAFILVSDLGISQFVLETFDSKYIVFLDKNLNAKGLNDWYLAREVTALSTTDSTIKMNPLLSYTNSKSDTLSFILAQSISLILINHENVLNEFSQNSWKISNDLVLSKWNKYFREIGFVSYYGRALKKINFDKSYEFYQLLEKTDFINLYATNSPQRDFIETSTIYIYNILLTKPFHIEFLEQNILLDSYSSCLKNARCLKKRQFLDELYRSLK